MLEVTPKSTRRPLIPLIVDIMKMKASLISYNSGHILDSNLAEKDFLSFCDKFGKNFRKLRQSKTKKDKLDLKNKL